jgi:proteasome lid subunit RPN8/RPN11
MWKFWKRKKTSDPIPLPPTVYICESIWGDSVNLLQEARDERSAHEGILYWAGKSCNDYWLLTTCIAPQAITTRGSFQTTSASNAEVIKFLASNNLELLAQVHSHPGTLIDHSGGDDEGALMPYENFLSIIVPHYAQLGILPLEKCGIHRFQGGKFVRLPEHEIKTTFKVVPYILNLRNNE